MKSLSGKFGSCCLASNECPHWSVVPSAIVGSPGPGTSLAKTTRILRVVLYYIF
jgi:hypothetical protein